MAKRSASGASVDATCLMAGKYACKLGNCALLRPTVSQGRMQGGPQAIMPSTFCSTLQFQTRPGAGLCCRRWTPSPRSWSAPGRTAVSEVCWAPSETMSSSRRTGGPPSVAGCVLGVLCSTPSPDLGSCTLSSSSEEEKGEISRRFLSALPFPWMSAVLAADWLRLRGSVPGVRLPLCGRPARGGPTAPINS